MKEVPQQTSLLIVAIIAIVAIAGMFIAAVRTGGESEVPLPIDLQSLPSAGMAYAQVDAGDYGWDCDYGKARNGQPTFNCRHENGNWINYDGYGYVWSTNGKTGNMRVTY